MCRRSARSIPRDWHWDYIMIGSNRIVWMHFFFKCLRNIPLMEEIWLATCNGFTKSAGLQTFRRSAPSNCGKQCPTLQTTAGSRWLDGMMGRGGVEKDLTEHRVFFCDIELVGWFSMNFLFASKNNHFQGFSSSLLREDFLKHLTCQLITAFLEVDPLEPNRVWFFSRATGTHTGPLGAFGLGPTGVVLGRPWFRTRDGWAWVNRDCVRESGIGLWMSCTWILQKRFEYLL